MQWTDRIRQVKIILVIAAIVIAVVSLLASHLLVKDLQREERNKMETWAKALNALNNADENTDLSLVLHVIQANNTIPVFVTEPDGTVSDYRNVEIDARTAEDSDVYISSSTLEGLPVSTLEAMYCGLPAILSSIPQHKEIYDVCSSIELIPLELDIWVKMIKRYALLSNNERIKKGLICKDCANRYFSLKSMHEKYDLIYEKIM